MPRNTVSDAHPESGANSTWWKVVVQYLKDIKDVLAAIAAISAAIVFAFNYFATAQALECFKTEARKSNELVQTILQVNELTATRQLTNVKLRQLDLKVRGLQGREESLEYESILKDIAQAQSVLEDNATRLDAARKRRNALEGIKPCD